VIEGENLRFVRELEELSSSMLRCLPTLFETSHARKQRYLAFFAHSLHSLKTVIDKHQEMRRIRLPR
ncbi:hypothetical protein, partial [Vreelandella alkaliphila]|uniref:hypothetical protein n=2 Tax=Vreelandella alkaliphila TaxID=272774 RepID=UPI003FD79E84